MPAQSDIARRAAAIEHEFDTRTSRLAGIMRGEFDADDATQVTDKAMHEIIRRNWSDPEWRVKTSQRMGPIPFYKAALEAFGRKLDGEPSKDSHPDALAAEPVESEPKGLPPIKPAKDQIPSVFPFQGEPAPTPQPVPVMPMPGAMPPPPMPGAAMPPGAMPPPIGPM